jgi:hypothetical protein
MKSRDGLPLREELPKRHAVVGDGYRLLSDDELLELGDETACISLLLSLEHFEGWHPVEAKRFGRTVERDLEADADRSERIYRRKASQSFPDVKGGIFDGLTTESLVGSLRGHRAPIVEADEWRPLAKHVLDLMRLAQKDTREDLACPKCTESPMTSWCECCGYGKPPPGLVEWRTEKIRADKAVAHSTEMESRSWAAEHEKTLLTEKFHKQEMQLSAAREERDEVRAELKSWLNDHPPSSCSAHQILDLKCPICNFAVRERDQALAACAEMRSVLEACGAEKFDCSVDGARIDHALSSEAGKGWISHEEHSRLMLNLGNKIHELCDRYEKGSK